MGFCFADQPLICEIGAGADNEGARLHQPDTRLHQPDTATLRFARQTEGSVLSDVFHLNIALIKKTIKPKNISPCACIKPNL